MHNSHQDLQNHKPLKTNQLLFYALPLFFHSGKKKLLEGSDVKVCCVIGFPLGAMTTSSKVFEARDAVEQGADEVDMVLNIGRLKDGEDDYVRNEIRAVKEAVGSRTLKVILETCLLNEEEKAAAPEGFALPEGSRIRLLRKPLKSTGRLAKENRKRLNSNPLLIVWMAFRALTGYHNTLNYLISRNCQEDKAFAQCKYNRLMRIPTAKEALGFSFDMRPATCYKMNGNRLPMGCHMWFKYDNETFWYPQIYPNTNS